MILKFKIISLFKAINRDSPGDQSPKMAIELITTQLNLLDTSLIRAICGITGFACSIGLMSGCSILCAMTNLFNVFLGSLAAACFIGLVAIWKIRGMIKYMTESEIELQEIKGVFRPKKPTTFTNPEHQHVIDSLKAWDKVASANTNDVGSESENSEEVETCSADTVIARSAIAEQVSEISQEPEDVLSSSDSDILESMIKGEIVDGSLSEDGLSTPIKDEILTDDDIDLASELDIEEVCENLLPEAEAVCEDKGILLEPNIAGDSKVPMTSTEQLEQAKGIQLCAACHKSPAVRSPFLTKLHFDYKNANSFVESLSEKDTLSEASFINSSFSFSEDHDTFGVPTTIFVSDAGKANSLKGTVQVQNRGGLKKMKLPLECPKLPKSEALADNRHTLKKLRKKTKLLITEIQRQNEMIAKIKKYQNLPVAETAIEGANKKLVFLQEQLRNITTKIEAVERETVAV